ncbi:MAG: thiamine phosphate synthase [Pseudomonadota bacterium]
MTEPAPGPEQPQLYLLTPPVFELSTYPDILARVLDAQDVACLRLALATHDVDRIARAADACRAVAHARDVAIVVSDHSSLAERLGLDGVHLSDAGKSVRDARKVLGPDAIVGSFCSTSRHDGLMAGEAGADYIAFGPLTALNADDHATAELFQWWSDVVEVPVVAEGALSTSIVERLAPYTDFFGIGEEIWEAEDPVAALKEMTAPLA